jgi:hypothetical protein
MLRAVVGAVLRDRTLRGFDSLLASLDVSPGFGNPDYGLATNVDSYVFNATICRTAS